MPRPSSPWPSRGAGSTTAPDHHGARLSRTGNFTTNGLSLDGNTSYTDTGDINDARTHNTANEVTDWCPDGTK